MKKRVWIITSACILILGAVIIAAVSVGGKKPYKDLDAAEVVSATVRLTPPDKTIEIEDIQELVEYLNDVTIYQEDNSYTEYDGQGVTFTLTLSDGTQTEIMACNPFLVIDGVGYQTKYDPCEALNGYANRLLSDEQANVILEKPPALTVISDETAVDALLGTYSWQKINSDGTATGIESDSAHPLDCEALLTKLETTRTTAVLRFAEDPDKILSIQCWSEERWGDTGASSEDVAIDGYEIELKPGGYIYEVKAEWQGNNGSGSAYYSFYVEAPDFTEE